jgi:hypothetical protein
MLLTDYQNLINKHREEFDKVTYFTNDIYRIYVKKERVLK